MHSVILFSGISEISCSCLVSTSSTHVPLSRTSLSYLCSSIFSRPLSTGILGTTKTRHLSKKIFYKHKSKYKNWHICKQYSKTFHSIGIETPTNPVTIIFGHHQQNIVVIYHQTTKLLLTGISF